MRKVPTFAGGKLIVASYDEFTPAGYFAHAAVVVPPIRDPAYIDHLIEVCRMHCVRVVLPLIDKDLERLAPHLERFAKIGTTVVCPPPDLVDLGMDKLRFARFAEAWGLSHPKTCLASELENLRFPAFFKRRRGYGSVGSGICFTIEQARAEATAVPDLVFQEYVRAPEVTVDAYISRAGLCTVCVPRSRDTVVGGESYNTHTIRDPAVKDLAMRTISALTQEGLRGPLNVQMFQTGPPMLIEVNTRIGSASVLSNAASGGRLLHSILIEASGGISEGDPDDYMVGLTLNRFLGDIFHEGGKVVAVHPTWGSK
jgi:carbamoyl-phosphate synthase large subunit